MDIPSGSFFGPYADAIGDLRETLAVARLIGEPSLVLRAAMPLLTIDGSDELAVEARAVADAIRSALPDDVRRGFDASELVEGPPRL
jgi:hypothetical protein